MKRFFLVFLFFFTANVAGAQVLDSNLFDELSGLVSQTDARIELSPEYPAPHSEITATLFSNSSNLALSDIAWLLDGQIISHGKGLTEFTFTTGDVGEVTELHAVISLQGGATFVAQMPINPAQVILLSEAETYTPPFYKGRSRYSADSFINLTAIPEIAKNADELYTPEELLFVWKKNSTQISGGVGLGKSEMRVKGPGFLGNDLISVDVLDPQGSVRGSIATIVTSESPQIIFYEKKPLIGPEYSQALANDSLVKSGDISVIAEPYFVSATSRNDKNLKYDWFIGREKAPIQDPSSEFRFNTEEQGSKKLQITVALNHLKNFIQNTKASVEVVITESLDDFGL